jgi:DNA-binding MarR family transcriptional regulator
METNGLIYRQHDDEDKRVVRIFLTKEGLKLREKVKEVVVSFNKNLFEKIKPEEMKGFVKVNNVIKELVIVEVDEFQNNNNPK